MLTDIKLFYSLGNLTIGHPDMMDPPYKESTPYPDPLPEECFNLTKETKQRGRGK